MSVTNQKGALVKIVSHGTEYDNASVLFNTVLLAEAVAGTGSREPTQKHSSITCTNPSTPYTHQYTSLLTYTKHTYFSLTKEQWHSALGSEVQFFRLKGSVRMFVNFPYLGVQVACLGGSVG